jgi:hypothetical protein
LSLQESLQALSKISVFVAMRQKCSLTARPYGLLNDLF